MKNNMPSVSPLRADNSRSQRSNNQPHQKQKQHRQHQQQQHKRVSWNRTTAVGAGAVCCCFVVSVVLFLGSGAWWWWWWYGTYTTGENQGRLWYNDPSRLRQRRQENKRPFRVFGPQRPKNNDDVFLPSETDPVVSVQWYTRDDQRAFLAEFGTYCQYSFVTTKTTTTAGYSDNNLHDNDQYNDNLLLQRFDQLPEALGRELWKYCVLYTGISNVYIDLDNLTPLVTWNDLLLGTLSSSHSSSSSSSRANTNVALEIHTTTTTTSTTTGSGTTASTAGGNSPTGTNLRLHHSFLQIAKHRSKVCVNMMRFLAESTTPHIQPFRLAELLGLYVSDTLTISATASNSNNNHNNNYNSSKKQQKWLFLSTRCEWTGEYDSWTAQQQGLSTQSTTAIPRPAAAWQQHASSSVLSERFLGAMPSTAATHSHVPTCPLRGRPCCQAWTPEEQRYPSLLVRDPYPALYDKSHNSKAAAPKDAEEGEGVNQEANHHDVNQEVDPSDDDFPLPFVDTKDENLLLMPASELPYIATVREEKTGMEPSNPLISPNFFDTLAENDCLPRGRECFRCLKSMPKTTTNAETTTNNDEETTTTNNNNGESSSSDWDSDEYRYDDACARCQDQCGCYCSALCNIRPPPKPITAIWHVRPPLFRKHPRLIPRIIHQTWYEPITKEKYPNMSRLVESFKQSGWEYHFYDDQQAGQFIATHFPPQVKQAYDAITPGAFKADLFRYCVLLIRGGVYSDMDVLLEASSQLDDILDPSVGFLTAQDEPGLAAGHRSCLWNGFMAAAPGHPFLVQTIETVVNNIRNRFTSIDYDDMLCPNPVLSVSHTTDMLFTCGPCILGASINRVLKRHPQTSFEYGELNLFQVEQQHATAAGDASSSWYNSWLASSAGSDGVNANAAAIVDILKMMDPTDLRFSIPGRSILLKQDKQDMGAHRFTLVVQEDDSNDDSNGAGSQQHTGSTASSSRSGSDKNNIVVASTDLPDYDDRPKSLVHYSKTHEKFGIYGLSKLYINEDRASEEIRIRMAT